ncbi:hypothetical protein ABDK00_014445 [Niabella insulamsoli]|uniref:hypothetical protein n=1 Tax=Niabella insulamsoli TaxID=3144874 RepID=UPI0031FBB99F
MNYQIQSIAQAAVAALEKLKLAIKHLDKDLYGKSIPLLFDASIGKHARHIIEMYQCLLYAIKSHKAVDYDARLRDNQIETDSVFAATQIDFICKDLLQIESNANVDVCCHGLSTGSNYARELLYQIEHSIHHMAFIKVGLSTLDISVGDPSFGVAPSTLTHQRTCAQ